jgi:hypothetical protein
MTKVYVVMGNDFPDAVFDSEAAAEAYCETKRDEKRPWTRTIYWRVYEFTLNPEE